LGSRPVYGLRWGQSATHPPPPVRLARFPRETPQSATPSPPSGTLAPPDNRHRLLGHLVSSWWGYHLLGAKFMSVPPIIPKRFSQAGAQPINWLWEPYLLRGKLVILDGD